MTLLDVRTEREFARGGLEGFVNIPLDELRERMGQLPGDRPVCVVCQSGLRSYVACRILTAHGFDAVNFAGGLRYYDAVVRDRRLVERSAPCGMDME